MNFKDIKFDHFKDIEELIKHLEMWYTEDDYYAYDRYFTLRDARTMGMYIYELQERLERIENYLDKNYTVENQYWFDHIKDIVKDR